MLSVSFGDADLAEGVVEAVFKMLLVAGQAIVNGISFAIDEAGIGEDMRDESDVEVVARKFICYELCAFRLGHHRAKYFSTFLRCPRNRTKNSFGNLKIWLVRL